ncbi:MAG: T9SS C-terminal target domain-containing protein [Saprospirales bacterium]|nr:MAG: T9SS C-terminal target domain-containing protein [Saprospirales bacterium]
MGTGGGIIGNMANGEIINCNSTMDVNATAGGGGGIAGIANRSTVSNSTYSGTVGTEGSGFFNGGIVGFIGQDVDVINVSSSGLVQSNQGAGGIVGSLSNGSIIQNSTSSAIVNANTRAGGLVGTIQSSAIDSSFFSGIAEVTNSDAGGIVGYIAGNNLTSITNVENFGDVTGIDRIGGIVGWQFGLADISYARNSGNITGEGSLIGGIIGYFSGSSNNGFRKLVNEGDLQGSGVIGGIFGGFDNNIDLILIDSVFSSGSVETNSIAGGLIGNATGVRLTNSSSTASISTEGIAGGLLGSVSNSEVEICFFNGIVESTSSFTGGIAAISDESNISNSFARGFANGFSGGIVGEANETIIFQTYSTMEMEPPFENNIIFQGNNNEIINSYFSIIAITGENPGGSRYLFIEDMTYPYENDVYTGWDFNNIWRHDFTGEINDGLPYFRSAGDEGFFYVLIGVNRVAWGEASGEGYFDEGGEVTLTAEANEGYRFLYWEDTDGMIISEDENYQFSMPAENVILTAVFDEATPIREIEGMVFKIYPNPVTDQLYIHADQTIQDVRLYNSTGQLIHHFSVNNNTVSINTSEIPVGTYLLSIQSDDHWINESIQVIR